MRHCYEFTLPRLFRKPAISNFFFHFPWNFEIAGFSCITVFNCRKTKTKEITLPNHRGHTQSSEPIELNQIHVLTEVKCGKMCAGESFWIWFYF